MNAMPTGQQVVEKVRTLTKDWRLPLHHVKTTIAGPTDMRGPVAILFELAEAQCVRLSVLIIPQTYDVHITVWFLKSLDPAEIISDTDVRVHLIQKPHNWEFGLELVIVDLAYQ